MFWLSFRRVVRLVLTLQRTAVLALMGRDHEYATGTLLRLYYGTHGPRPRLQIHGRVQLQVRY